MRRTLPLVAAALLLALLVSTALRRAPAPLDGTTILVLRARPGSLELVSTATKPFRCEAQDRGDLRFTVEDERGVVLADGAVAAPALCRCGGPDHAPTGCVTPRHEAVVRVKVPHRAERERVSFRDGRGEPIGSFVVEAKP
jgi:hypothetical protein